MRVPSALILAFAACLLSTASATTPTKDSHYAIYSSETGTVVKLMDRNDCDKPADNLNANEPYICLDEKHFLKIDHFKDVPLNKTTLSLLYRYASGNPNGTNGIQANKDLMTNVAKNIGKDVNVDYKSNNELGKWYPYLPATFFSNRKDSIKSLLEAANDKDQLKAMLDKLDTTIVKESKADIFVQMNTSKLDMKDLGDSTQTALLNEADGCSGLNAEQFFGFDSNSFSKMTYGCLSNIANLSTYSHWDVRIRHIPTTVISHDIKLDGSAYKHMTAAQIAALGTADKDAIDICKQVPLNAYLKANGAKMTPHCFALALGEITDTTALRDTFRFLPANILSEVTEKDHVAKLVNEWPFISIEQKKHLFDGKKCADIPEQALNFHNRFAISQECFTELPTESKPQAVIHATLPDTALESIDADEVGKWELGDYKKLAVFEAASHQPNIAKLLEHASTKINDEHICKLVTSLDELVALKVIQEHGTKACFDAMEYKVTLNDLSKLDSRVEQVISVEALVKAMETKEYKDLTAETLGRLAKVSNICSAMTKEIFEELSDARREFPADCLNQLTFLGDLPKPIIASLPAKAFATMSADKFSKIPAENLSDEQFGMAGSEIADAASHPASLWTKETVEKFTSGSVRHIHSSAFKAAPAAAYQGFSESAFRSIKPESMEEMTHDQISQVPEAALLEMSVDQAKHIGLKVTNGTHPLTSVASLKGLPDPVNKVVQSRMTAAPAAPA